MTITLDVPVRRLGAWLCGAMLLVAAGCGGDDPAAEETAAPGDPVVATVDGEGGSVAFKASGIDATLAFPGGALAGTTVVTVTPLAPSATQWMRVRVTGPRGVLGQPATLTLRLPAGRDPGPDTTGVAIDGPLAVPLTTVVDGATRTVTMSLQQFADVAPAVTAQAQRRPAAGETAPTEVAAERAMTTAERYAAVEATVRVHEREQKFATAFRAAAALTTIRLEIEGGGGSPDPAGVVLLTELKRIACANLSSAVNAAALADAPVFGPGGADPVQWRANTVEPIHFWLGIVERLGDGPCAGVDAAGTLLAAETRFRTAAESKLAAGRDPATVRDVAPGLARAKTLVAQDRLLGIPAQADQVQQEVLQPVIAPLRVTAWDASANGTTHDHYGDVLRIYGLGSALETDLQMVGTSLYVTSYEGGSGSAALGSGSAGGGAGPTQTTTVTTVAARAGGSVDVTGPINVLHCPAAASETLVVEFEGAKVLERASVGSRLLDGRLSFAVSTLLSAAGIDPATRGVHTLLVKRVGSSCNPALGTVDVVLVQLRLDFAAGQAPAPSKITGRVFSGRMIEFYMPFDSGCSTSCLAGSPYPDRCPVSGWYDTTLSVSGDPGAYEVTVNWKHRDADPAQAPHTDLFRGSGTPWTVDRASWSSGLYLQGSTMGFSVSDQTDALRGVISYQCHRLEMELQGAPG